MTYDVYGVGNALVDIQARISDETLHELQFGKGLVVQSACESSVNCVSKKW